VYLEVAKMQSGTVTDQGSLKAGCSVFQCRLYWTSVSPKLWKTIWRRFVLSFSRKTQKRRTL